MTGLDPGVTCPDDKELFEVSCSISDGFDVRINESCRKSYFPFIDFTNSFVWGDSSKTQMDNPTGSAGSDVDQVCVYFLLINSLLVFVDHHTVNILLQSFGGACSNVKFSSTGSVKDTDGVNSWNIKIPLSDCSMTETTEFDSSWNKYTEYSLCWNSQLSDDSPVQQLLQVGQVKLVCRVDSFQVYL